MVHKYVVTMELEVETDAEPEEVKWELEDCTITLPNWAWTLRPHKVVVEKKGE